MRLAEEKEERVGIAVCELKIILSLVDDMIDDVLFAFEIV